MSATTRELFLSRVAQAVRAGDKYRETNHRELPETVGYLGAGAEPIGRLVDELVKAGASAVRVRTRDEVAASVGSVVSRFSVRTAVLNGGDILKELDLGGMLRECGVVVTAVQELTALEEPVRRDRLFAADLGVASPDWAIAETGTLVYAAAAQQLRSTSLLPPVHLAIVDSRCILPDLLDLPARLAGRSDDGVPPRNVALITGPSKTGDIELKLTTGVHGPGDVHVLVWERGEEKEDS